MKKPFELPPPHASAAESESYLREQIASLSAKELKLMRWCVLTVSKGFVAVHEGQAAACELMDKLDPRRELR